jgi:hypothetical protein
MRMELGSSAEFNGNVNAKVNGKTNNLKAACTHYSCALSGKNAGKMTCILRSTYQAAYLTDATEPNPYEQ